MEQLVIIVDKKRLKMKDILQVVLLTPSPTSDFKGCQETFTEFKEILKIAASIVPPSVTIKVDPDIPVVVHIWPGMKGIIFNVKKFKKPF